VDDIKESPFIFIFKTRKTSVPCNLHECGWAGPGGGNWEDPGPDMKEAPSSGAETRSLRIW